MITPDLLLAIMPESSETNRAMYAPHLNESMQHYAINTQLRAAAFLATIAEESGELNYSRELWGPTPAQKDYEPPSDKATELGNKLPGDGFTFRGRGLIQITGRANYQQVSDALSVDFVSTPMLLQQPRYAVESACWFWMIHGCNPLADKGDFYDITRRVNGGLTHYSKRVSYYNAALRALGKMGESSP